jgi:hypothetical protein
MPEHISATGYQLELINKSCNRLLALFGVKTMCALNGMEGPLPATQLMMAIGTTAIAPDLESQDIPLMVITKPKQNTLVTADTIIRYVAHGPTRDSQVALYKGQNSRLRATMNTFPHITEATELSEDLANNVVKDLLQQRRDIYRLLSAH